jgi:predicted  nucleic acid-binding Zn-ribbon protein
MTIMDHLLSLHRVDSQVRALRSRLANAERDLKAQEAVLGKLLAREQEFASQARQVQATMANLELDERMLKERIDKLRADMSSSPNDKQYKALHNELENAKARSADISARWASEGKRLESIEAEAAKVATQIAERRKIVAVVKAQFDERTAECSARLAELEAERKKAAAAVPERERTLFDRAADVTEGEPMAEVDEIDRRHREYVCGACRIEIPYAHVTTLMSNPNAVVQCTACTRILYLAEATKEVLRK